MRPHAAQRMRWRAAFSERTATHRQDPVPDPTEYSWTASWNASPGRKNEPPSGPVMLMILVWFQNGENAIDLLCSAVFDKEWLHGTRIAKCQFRSIAQAHTRSARNERHTPFPRDQCASGSGLIWICTARGLEPLPVSINHGVRSPLVLQSLRPFQPAFGSSMRPSRPLA